MTQLSKRLIAVVLGVWITYLVVCALYTTKPAPAAHTHAPNVKHILLWPHKTSPFDLIDDGFLSFIKNKCDYFDCMVTDDQQLFSDITEFDAIVFNGKLLTTEISLPRQRSPRQKYIFAATESAHNYRVCSSIYDGYFNWTWTYKLDSDMRWGYVSVYDVQGRVVGPKADMVWPALRPIDEALKTKLSKKSKGAAWFVSNCRTQSKREEFYGQLQKELINSGYNWSIDVYGKCGTHRCTRRRARNCYKLVEENYHFYFSFENSFAEDYVTEKLLTALNNYAIPVVYGGANYSRFLPPGSYLDARELGTTMLLKTMNELILDKEKYCEFFRWRNHYVYKGTVHSTDICNLCTALHNERLMQPSIVKELRRWWNTKSQDGSDSTCGR